MSGFSKFLSQSFRAVSAIAETFGLNSLLTTEHPQISEASGTRNGLPLLNYVPPPAVTAAAAYKIHEIPPTCGQDHTMPERHHSITKRGFALL